jgi:hypothetical protein
MNKVKDYVEYYGFDGYKGYEIEAILGKQLWRFVTLLYWAAAKTNDEQVVSQVIDRVVTVFAMQDIRATIEKQREEEAGNLTSQELLDELLNGKTSFEEEVAKA